MTLNDIVVSALAQLDRGHDAQTLDMWRDKLTRLANDAVLDLALTVKPRKRDTVTLTGKFLDSGDLSRRPIKILSVKQSGRELEYLDAYTLELMYIPNAVADAEVEVTYVYMPSELSATTDVPELPELCHPLIVTYVVGRERATRDVSVQRGGNIYFQMYEAGKRKLRSNIGGDGSYMIVNRY